MSAPNKNYDPVAVTALSAAEVDRALEAALGNAEDARRVDQHQLRARPALSVIGQVGHGDTDDPHARGLHLGRDDGDLGADQTVEQRRLADIGRADQGDESAALLL